MKKLVFVSLWHRPQNFQEYTNTNIKSWRFQYIHVTTNIKNVNNTKIKIITVDIRLPSVKEKNQSGLKSVTMLNVSVFFCKFSTGLLCSRNVLGYKVTKTINSCINIKGLAIQRCVENKSLHGSSIEENLSALVVDNKLFLKKLCQKWCW